MYYVSREFHKYSVRFKAPWRFHTSQWWGRWRATAPCRWRARWKSRGRPDWRTTPERSCPSAGRRWRTCRRRSGARTDTRPHGSAARTGGTEEKQVISGCSDPQVIYQKETQNQSVFRWLRSRKRITTLSRKWWYLNSTFRCNHADPGHCTWRCVGWEVPGRPLFITAVNTLTAGDRLSHRNLPESSNRRNWNQVVNCPQLTLTSTEALTQHTWSKGAFTTEDSCTNAHVWVELNTRNH